MQRGITLQLDLGLICSALLCGQWTWQFVTPVVAKVPDFAFILRFSKKTTVHESEVGTQSMYDLFVNVCASHVSLS